MTTKLLIADDNARVRQSLVRLLTGDGIEIVEAETCQEAICLAAQLDVDAVLLDVNMPDGNGLDVLAKIKESRPTLPVVMHSEHDRASYAALARQRGAAGYLVKGVEKDELCKILDDAIRRAKQVPLP